MEKNKNIINYLKYFCYVVIVVIAILTLMSKYASSPNQAIENAIRDSLKNNQVNVSTNFQENYLEINNIDNQNKKFGILKWSDFSDIVPIFEKGTLRLVETVGSSKTCLITSGGTDIEYLNNYKVMLISNLFNRINSQENEDIYKEDVYKKDEYILTIKVNKINSEDLKMELCSIK